VKHDSIASMRCWAIEVNIGGQEFTIPPLPAASWWPVLIDPRADLFLAMIPGEEVEDVLLSQDADLGEALVDAIEAAAGRSVNAALLLAAVAESQWPAVNGQLIRDGIRWDVLPLAAVLDAIQSLIMERLPEEERAKFLAALDRPMPSSAARIDHEQAAADFESMAGPRPTGGVRRPVTADTAVPPERSTVARSGGRPARTPPRSPLRRPHALSGAPTELPARLGPNGHSARSVPLDGAAEPASDSASRPRRR
jgi:hypothetical protein